MDDRALQKEKLVTRSFLIAFETLFIFGIPAILGVLLGRFLQDYWNTGKWVLYLTLIVMFVLSWAAFLARVRKVSREIRQIQEGATQETERQ